MNPLLAGGSLLDLGPYPLLWVSFTVILLAACTYELQTLLALYENPANNGAVPVLSSASMLKAHTGVDAFTSWTLDFMNLGARADRK